MANETNRAQPHELRLDDRSKLSVSGVSEVESFDESTVVLHTARGVLVIKAKQKVRLLPALNIPWPLLKQAVETLCAVCAELEVQA